MDAKNINMIAFIFLVISCSVSKPIVNTAPNIAVIQENVEYVRKQTISDIPDTALTDDEKEIRDRLVGIDNGIGRLDKKMDGLVDGNKRVLEVTQATQELNILLFDRSRELRTQNDSLQSRILALRDFAVNERKERIDWQKQNIANTNYGENIQRAIRIYSTIMLLGLLVLMVMVGIVYYKKRYV